MSEQKNLFLSSALTPEARKNAFIKEYPFYANWPHWDDWGMPSPDPKELESFTDPCFDFEEPL